MKFYHKLGLKVYQAPICSYDMTMSLTTRDLNAIEKIVGKAIKSEIEPLEGRISNAFDETFKILNGLKYNFGGLKYNFGELQQAIGRVETRMDSVENQLDDVKTTLGNQTKEIQLLRQSLQPA